MLLKTLIVLFSFCTVNSSYAQGVLALSQNPGTLTTASIPATKSVWSNAANASSANNIYTTAPISNRKHTNLLVATNWGFTVGNGTGQIPSNAIINGILVEVKMKASSKGVRDYIIQLQKNNSTTSANLARSNTAWPATLNYVKFGSSTNLWGTTWTAAELAASAFGVNIAAQGKTQPGTAYIDHIKITVYFNLRFYYSKSAGNLTATSTWGVNLDGSGSNPPNFTDSGQIFTLRNRAAATLNADMTIAGQASKLIIGNDTSATALTLPATAALTALADVASLSTLNISNAISPTLGSLANNSTVAYNALANQTVDEVTFYNLTLGGSGTKTSDVTGNPITVNGDFTINSGITFNNTDEDLVVNGNFINSGIVTGPSYIWMNGLAASTISGMNGIISNLKTDNDISVTLSNSQIITDTLALTSSSLVSTTFLNLYTNAVVVRDEGTLTAAPVSSLLYDVQYIGSTKTTGPEIAGTIRDLLISLTDTIPNTVSLSQVVALNGKLKIDSGTLDATTGNYNISVKNNILMNGTLNNRSNIVTLNGNALQTISGTSSAITFNQLVVNNTGGVQILSPILVNNTFTFSNGIVTTDNVNKITLGSTATTTGASSTRYINGPLSKILATTTNTTFVYPVGASSLYRPVTLEVTQAAATATTYTLEMINSAPPAATLPSTLTSVSAYRYYKVAKGAGANVTTAYINLNYGAEDNITLPAHTRIAERNGSSWVDLGGTGNTTPAGSIRSSVNFTTFNDFVLADNTATLPVSLMSFKGVLNNGTVKIQWIASTEINVERYEVQKSVNGINWSTSSITLSDKTSQLQHVYNVEDKNPYSGLNYYRIKIIDKNSSYKFSNVITVNNLKNVLPQVTMLPNIIANHQANLMMNGFSYNSGELFIIKIYNSTGTMVQKKTCAAGNQISVNVTGLTYGVYTLVTEIKGQNYSSKFVVQ